MQFTATDFNSYNKVRADVAGMTHWLMLMLLVSQVRTGVMEGVVKTGGRMTCPTGSGLGVEPCWEVLGDPVFVVQ